MRRDQLILARPDQVGTAHADQGFAQHRPAFRIVIAQERLVQASLFFALDDAHRSALVGNGRAGLFARLGLQSV